MALPIAVIFHPSLSVAELCIALGASCAVITLKIVLKNQPPVRVDSVRLFMGNLSVVQIIAQRLS